MMEISGDLACKVFTLTAFSCFRKGKNGNGKKALLTLR